MPLLKEEAGSVSASTVVLFLLQNEKKTSLQKFILRVRYYSRIPALPVGVCTICIRVCIGTRSLSPLSTNWRQTQPGAIMWPNTVIMETKACTRLVWGD